MTKKSLIILADGFEEIEAVTPIDILRRADIEVSVASLNPKVRLVKGSHGIYIQAETALDELTPEDYDACILPGGPGVKNLAASELVKSIILNMHAQGKLIAAICAAPAIVLAPIGILDKKNATCYLNMENHFSDTTIFHADPVVIDSNIITSRGAGTAMAFSLAIVEKLCGKDVTEKIKTLTATP